MMDDGLIGKIWMNGGSMGLENHLLILSLIGKNWTRKSTMKALEDKHRPEGGID